MLSILPNFIDDNTMKGLKIAKHLLQRYVTLHAACKTGDGQGMCVCTGTQEDFLQALTEDWGTPVMFNVHQTHVQLDSHFFQTTLAWKNLRYAQANLL